MLTDAAVRNAKPAEKPYKLADANGLHLWVTPAGGKAWRFRTRAGGKDRLVTLGTYPEMGLGKARTRRDEVADAGGGTLVGLAGVTFEVAAEGWLASRAPMWKPHHAADVRGTLASEVLPILGAKPLGKITAPDVLAVLRPVQARGAVELAHRLRARISSIYTYAIASGLAAANPAAALTAALVPVVRQGRRPAVLDLDAARAVLTAVEATPAHPVTLLAHRLLALTALRPGEVRLGRWAELVDLDGPAPLWRVPGARMKHNQREVAGLQDHVVPLSWQAVEAFKALRLMSGRGALMFPSWSHPDRPITDNALVYLLNRAGLGGRQVPHGWRATFSTVMNERHPADRQAIDLMLAHRPPGAVEAAYNRSTHAARRRELAQAWADMLLDGARSAADLLDVPRR